MCPSFMRVGNNVDLIDTYSSLNSLSVISTKRAYLTAKLFDYCVGCNKIGMAAVPQGAFAAYKVRLNEEATSNWQRYLLQDQEPDHPGFERTYSSNSAPKVNESTMEQPMKYSSILMNSIWGLYNRYSVHNFKKNTDGKEALVGDHHFQVAYPTLKRFVAACEKH